MPRKELFWGWIVSSLFGMFGNKQLYDHKNLFIKLLTFVSRFLCVISGKEDLFLPLASGSYFLLSKNLAHIHHRIQPDGWNNPYGRKKQAGDASGRLKSSLWNKKARQRCIRPVEIIPAEQKIKTEMHPAGWNHPCGTKKLAGDVSGQKKSSLWNKKASWGCIRPEEIISVEQKS